VSAIVKDVDRRRGYFQGVVEWGPNVRNGTVDESMIDRYYVLVVDSCDVVLSVAGMVPKHVGTPTGCCKADAYRLSVNLELPPNYHRFNIMAVKDSSPKFIVQGGLSSGPITDLYTVPRVNGAPSMHAVCLVMCLLTIVTVMLSC